MRYTMMSRLEGAVADAMWNMQQGMKIAMLEERKKDLESRKPSLLQKKAVEMVTEKIRLAYNADTIEDLNAIE